MGILNITPDSFSDGGQYLEVQKALECALTMEREGADIIDVGGESTRPGSLPVSAEVQIARTIPVIHTLFERLSTDVRISIDTTQSKVATAAIKAGAKIINDISAGTDDADMFGLIARYNASVILTHRKGTSLTMQDHPTYEDVVGEVAHFLVSQSEKAIRAGVPPNHIFIDPGIGFGKTTVHNIALLSALDTFVGLGYPVVLGTSRKRFMGAICQHNHSKELIGATVATTVLGVKKGVSVFRVHDVLANRQAIDITLAILN